MATELLIPTHNGEQRCWWPGVDEQYVEYHDTEWGRPVDDGQRLFEKLCLEGFQAGLSWLTILRKRENFRVAFAQFNFHDIARFDNKDIERLLADAGIVRHRGKIEATINNAARAIELIDDVESLSAYLWSFAPDTPYGRDPELLNEKEIAATSPSSIALSKDLKKRGWKFVGPTTVYSFMQSMGLVNDHVEGCCVRDVCEEQRQLTKAATTHK